jgi:RimJ/RimL family protein N-acetyltransferase
MRASAAVLVSRGLAQVKPDPIGCYDGRTLMCEGVIETDRLQLVPKTLDEVRAQIARMTAGERAQLSADWLSQLDSPMVNVWTLGFDIVERATGRVVGSCGFKGPPGRDGIVEIAYGVDQLYRGMGIATETAAALVAWAWGDARVRRIRAHTYAALNASTRVLMKCGFHSVGEVFDPEDGLVSRWEIE